MVRALNALETAELLASESGLRDPDLADQLLELTAGWRELAQTGARMLADGVPHTPLLQWFTTPSSPLTTLITGQVLPGLSAEARHLLDDVAGLAPVTPGLAAAVGGHPVEVVLELGETGVLVREQVVPVIARVCLDLRGGTPPFDLAASWYQENGYLASALKSFAQAGDLGQCGQLLERHGPRLLAAGHSELLIEVLERLAPARRSRLQQLLLGDALRTSGSPMRAAQAYSVIADATPHWDAALAWRMGQVHYHRGDSRAALKAFARSPQTGRPSADQAILLAWRASAHLQLGETTLATQIATGACQQAASVADDSAMATAYVSLALCHSMSGNFADGDELLAQALAIAEKAGDLVIRSRVLTTQTFRLIGEARYAEALETARSTGQCALIAGHMNLRLLALCNEADVLMMLGRYDEAIQQYERAQALSRRMGSRRSAAAQIGLGEIYRNRGWTEQARSAYEIAIQLAEESGLNQIHVNALAGLSRVLLTEDLQAAVQAADNAVKLAADRVTVIAAVAKGWTLLHAGDSPAALKLADEAATSARAERHRHGLAECLELKAAAEPDAKRAKAALREALSIWATAGASVLTAKLQLKIGSLPDAGTDERLAAMLAAEVLTAAGVPVSSGQTESTVEIRAFGRFEVLLNGEVIPTAQWQSRKARDLLRILVARRGRPVPRGELCELLWPDDDPSKTGHRLSVLLSIIRGVLDPAKAFPTEYYLIADQSCIGLDVTRLRVDVEEFMADTGHGRRLRDRGALVESYRLLTIAVRAYRAEVFEDEPYAEWSGALREEARAAYLHALRGLAEAGHKLGHPANAVEYLLRLLTIDPYDEAAHRALIEALTAGGQHGEAKRAHDRYETAMRAIGVRPT